MYKLTIDESSFNNIIDCIRQCYEEYTGDNEFDQDVYEFNTSLDNLINTLNENKETMK